MFVSKTDRFSESTQCLGFKNSNHFWASTFVPSFFILVGTFFFLNWFFIITNKSKCSDAGSVRRTWPLLDLVQSAVCHCSTCMAECSYCIHRATFKHSAFCTDICIFLISVAFDGCRFMHMRYSFLLCCLLFTCQLTVELFLSASIHAFLAVRGYLPLMGKWGGTVVVCGVPSALLFDWHYQLMPFRSLFKSFLS